MEITALSFLAMLTNVSSFSKNKVLQIFQINGLKPYQICRIFWSRKDSPCYFSQKQLAELLLGPWEALEGLITGTGEGIIIILFYYNNL
jgi:hypothetical protein